MYIPSYTTSFQKDVLTAKKRGWDLKDLEDISTKLIEGKQLEPKNKVHSLKGNYTGFTGCHIKPDWVLIYKIEDNRIKFARTGSHSDLFK